MKLYRFQVVPESAWLTRWQSDTLSGLLCWALARTEGDAALQRDVIEPALQGVPAFVLSDAFPADWLPVPALVRLADWPAQDRKTVKKAKWLSTENFRRVQSGASPQVSEFILSSGIHEYTQLRNTIGRANNSTADGGGLFPIREAVLGKDQQQRPIEYLTIYARIRDDFVTHFWRLIQELAFWGFGADRSAGKGQFRIGSKLESWDAGDAVAGANGCAVLSTFQPNTGDPTEGAWEAFTKYGKLGPDFGLDNVFKRPLILLRPGGCFRVPHHRDWVGRAIPMNELLAPDVVADLSGRGLNIVHWAFGLCVPIVWQPENAQ